MGINPIEFALKVNNLKEKDAHDEIQRLLNVLGDQDAEAALDKLAKTMRKIKADPSEFSGDFISLSIGLMLLANCSHPEKYADILNS